MELVEIREDQLEEAFALYREAIGSFGCVWDDEYPKKDIICEDIKHRDLLGFLDENGQVIAAIAIDRDEEVDRLDCWSKDTRPAAELARLVVSKDYRNQGMARQLIIHIQPVLKTRGYNGVHYLVAKDNIPAIRSYEKLSFEFAGDVNMFGHEYKCYEKKL